MKKLLFPLLLVLLIAGCHSSEDPSKAFQDLELLQSMPSAQFNWLQKGNWVFNQGDSICAQTFVQPEVFGPCEGTVPNLFAYSNYLTSPTGDTVLIWNSSTTLDPYCHVLDLRNAPDVIYLGKFQPNGVNTTCAGIHNGYMYATKDAHLLGVYDLSLLDPQNAILEADMEVGAVSLDEINFTHVAAFQDTFAYVGGNGNPIYVLSIADPIRPRVLSALKVQLSNGLTVYGGHLYNRGNASIDILSLSDPAHPLPVARIDEIHSKDMKWRDRYLYTVSESSLYIYDIGTPASPVLVRRINVPGELLLKLWFFGDYLMAASIADVGFVSNKRLYFYPNVP
jgi:hypothetical protein